MKLIIQKGEKVSSLQQAFQEQYPYLKLAFQAVRNPTAVQAHLDVQYPGKQEPGPNFNFARKGQIDISPSRKVADLQRDLYKKFGLHAHLYRKSGKLWIETSLTTDWSLERQNKEGEIYSLPPVEKSLEERMEDTRLDAE